VVSIGEKPEMKKIIYIVVTLVLIAQLGFAQQDQKNLQRQLLNLYRKITELRELATRYQDPRALKLVNNALEQYRDALNSLNQNPPRYLLARSQFIKAKQLANQAAKLLLFKPALRYLRDLESLIQKAEVALHRSNNEDGRYLLNKSRAFKEEAQRSLNTGQFLRAQEFYKISRFFAERSLKVAGGGVIAADSFEDQYKNLNSLLFSLGNQTIENPVIRELITKIQESLKKAQRLYENGNAQQAMVQMRITERFLYRAIDLQRSSTGDKNDRLKENLYSLKRYIEAIEDEIDSEKRSSAGKFLEKAKTFYAEAEQSLLANQPQKTRKKILLSQRMATKAMQLTNKTGKERMQDNLDKRMDELDQLLNLQKDKINADTRQSIQIMHQEATQLLIGARGDLAANRVNQAFQKTRLSARLLNRIERVLNKQEISDQNRDQVRSDLDRIGNLLNKIQDNQEIDTAVQSQVEFLVKLLQKAEQLYSNGNINDAAELAHLIQNQVDNLLKENI